MSEEELRDLVIEVNKQIRKNKIPQKNFISSADCLKTSLTFSSQESSEELRAGDGIEEFVFAYFEFEKERSGVDYLTTENSEGKKSLHDQKKDGKTYEIWTVQEEESEYLEDEDRNQLTPTHGQNNKVSTFAFEEKKTLKKSKIYKSLGKDTIFRKYENLAMEFKHRTETEFISEKSLFELTKDSTINNEPEESRVRKNLINLLVVPESKKEPSNSISDKKDEHGSEKDQGSLNDANSFVAMETYSSQLKSSANEGLSSERRKSKSSNNDNSIDVGRLRQIREQSTDPTPEIKHYIQKEISPKRVRAIHHTNSFKNEAESQNGKSSKQKNRFNLHLDLVGLTKLKSPPISSSRSVSINKEVIHRYRKSFQETSVQKLIKDLKSSYTSRPKRGANHANNSLNLKKKVKKTKRVPLKGSPSNNHSVIAPGSVLLKKLVQMRKSRQVAYTPHSSVHSNAEFIENVKINLTKISKRDAELDFLDSLHSFELQTPKMSICEGDANKTNFLRIRRDGLDTFVKKQQNTERSVHQKKGSNGSRLEMLISNRVKHTVNGSTRRKEGRISKSFLIA